MEKEISPVPFKQDFKILIIEDNDIFRQTLRHLLNSHYPFLNMDEATTSRNGFQKFNIFKPNLIFIDLRLSGSSGLELTENIRSSGSSIPIVILSSYDTPEHQEAAYAYGANYFLSKAKSSAQEILNLVDSFLH